jgi:hypothetical protein
MVVMAAEGEAAVDLANRLALGIGEAADALGISERHLRNHLSEIPHVFIGNRVVVPVDAAREWLRERVQTQRSETDTVVDEVVWDMLK